MEPVADSASDPAAFGVVAIGRNEGERLRTCLESVLPLAQEVVYVDSGSSDDSVEMATALGASVVALDMSVPFTAARARNEGFQRLRQLAPNLNYVQFVDGDCEVREAWCAQAATFLARQGDVAVVAGRLRERHPERSIYNLLCDAEWDTPVGETKSCGGIAMFRVSAFAGAGGFRSGLIAGEEPELCVRLRAAGWKIWRLDGEMALHDAAMTEFWQWWKRSVRCGYAYAEGAVLHGAPPERHRVRECRSARMWALAPPALAVVLCLFWGAWGLLPLGLYPLQVLRMYARGRGPRRVRWWRAVFLVLGKFAELAGQIKFLAHRLAGSKSRLIEYK
jgi:GT2 family glycosyltransferase